MEPKKKKYIIIGSIALAVILLIVLGVVIALNTGNKEVTLIEEEQVEIERMLEKLAKATNYAVRPNGEFTKEDMVKFSIANLAHEDKIVKPEEVVVKTLDSNVYVEAETIRRYIIEYFNQDITDYTFFSIYNSDTKQFKILENITGYIPTFYITKIESSKNNNYIVHVEYGYPNVENPTYRDKSGTVTMKRIKEKEGTRFVLVSAEGIN